MIVTNKIKMDLTNRRLTPTVDVMQDDQMSRSLEISLYSGLEAFELPENCVALVRYKKANGNSGMYDAMPDGVPAWSISKNVVTIALAPQVCSAAGTVSLTVVLLATGISLAALIFGCMSMARVWGILKPASISIFPTSCPRQKMHRKATF